MIISPPFLPPRSANKNDKEYVDEAMPGGLPGSGGYPVSYSMTWHGGIHLTPPALPTAQGGGPEPVRAIADGTVIFIRPPTTPHVTDPKHALNYNGGWTSDGCVVIKHETEIGEGADGAVTYYSIYMHLETINTINVKLNQPIWRKTEMGGAGYLYGQPNKLHLEIIADDTNVKRLVGRATGDLPLGADGRTTTCWGDMHFHLPSGTRLYDAAPANLASATQTGGNPTQEDFFVRMHYSNGNCIMTTFKANGETVGTAITDTGFEYNLYTNATKRYPLCPSAGYELLRFGRVLGPDALNPAGAGHWRQIPGPNGAVWVNLNAPNVHKFSDADFPHWLDWTLIEDDDRNSRCDAPAILQMLDLNHDGHVTQAEANDALEYRGSTLPDNLAMKQRLTAAAAVQKKIKHYICKFPTEWNAATIDAQWDWLKSESTDASIRLTEDDYQLLKEHINKLAFWPGATGLDAVHWHFHPREFIKLFRKCGWLSLNEMTQLLPRMSGPSKASMSKLEWNIAQKRIHGVTGGINYLNINKMFRKYSFVGALRQTAFFSQAFIETGILRLVREGGLGKPNPLLAMTQYYTAFYGRGLIQTTWPSNYDKYGKFRGFASNSSGSYADTRITATSVHDWASPTKDKKTGQLKRDMRQWAPRYDPDIVASDGYSICDSAAFFWVDKSYIGQSNIHRVVDTGFSTEVTGRVSILVNGGGNGYADRLQYSAYVYRVLSDTTDNSASETISYKQQKITSLNHHTVWGESPTLSSIYVDYTPQRK